MTWRDSVAPLRDRQFRCFFASRSVNIAGSMMAPIALAFAVLAIEDSATALGQVLAARSVPMVVFLLLGGVIADRVDRRLVIQVVQPISAPVAGPGGLPGHHRAGRAVAPDRHRGGQRHLVGRVLPRDAGDDPAAGAARPAPVRQRAALDGPRRA